MIAMFETTQKTIDSLREEIKNEFDALKEFVKKSRIEDVTSDITIFVDQFVRKRNLIYDLTKGELIVFYEANGANGILDRYKDIPDLHQSLFQIILKNFAIPENADDEIAISAIDLLTLGTQAYFSVIFFLIYGYSYLANYYYEIKNIEKFNKYILILAYQIKNFESIVIGENGKDGLISSVIRILNKIENLEFIKEEREDIIRLLKKTKNALEKVKVEFGKLENISDFIENKPNVKIEYDFNSNLTTPFSDWIDGQKVSYASHFKNGTQLSQISNLSENYKVFGNACPIVKFNQSKANTSELVFLRKISGSKPEVVKIIEDENQKEFKDIDKALLNVVLNPNETLALLDLKKLLKNGANVNASYANKKHLIHFLIELNKINLVSELLNHGIDISAEDSNARQAIHIATNFGFKDLIEILLKNNANVNARTILDWTPVLFACNIENEENAMNIIDLLIEKGADITMKTKNDFTCLHIAASAG